MAIVRTRIAPSPTGMDLHIGNAYTALINYSFAKKHGGKFIIRIEDTDRARLVEGSEKNILSSLAWLGISHDEGPDIGGPYAPYRQSERLDTYKTHAEKLVADGHAYYCFCTPERLEQMRKDQEAKHLPPMYDGLCKRLDALVAKNRVVGGEKHVIRLNVPEEGTTSFRDVIRGDVSFENKLIDDQVLLKSDGYPTYHLGVVVDDHSMKISHIIRGEEWISSTPKHILLYQFFGWELPIFAHVSVLRNPDRSKLSKRKNPVWVSDYKAKGFIPEAMNNYLATMAWSYPGGKDIFSVSEMIKAFKLEDIQTTAPIFSTEKLRWMNGEYLRKKSDDEVILLIQDFYKEKKYDGVLLRKILPLVKERMKLLSEFDTLAGFFFKAPPKKPVQPEIEKALRNSEWNHDAIEKTIRDTAGNLGLKAKDVFMDLRIAVTGNSVGPPLLESFEVLGKEETLVRLR